MSNQELTPEMKQAELEAARSKADMLGVPYKSNQGAASILKACKAKQAEMAGEEPEAEEVVEATAAKSDDVYIPYKDDGSIDKSQLKINRTKYGRMLYHPKVRKALHDEAMKLVRIKITCMNPSKKEWKGEVITFQNSVLGAVRKFVPFNCEAGDAYHVPYCIYQTLVAREFQSFSGVRVKGVEVKKGRQVKEFAIEVLPPLTQAELDAIAKKQRMDDKEE